jgi:hypothetical protein
MMPAIGVVFVRHQKEPRSVASPTAFYRLLLPKRQTSPYPRNNAIEMRQIPMSFPPASALGSGNTGILK